jgi:transposase
MQWVGASSQLLGPLVAALAKHVLAAKNLNADDTPIKVLAPGSGTTKRGHLWTYVRDGTGWGSTDPPAVWYQYSPSWHGKYPQKHLASFEGKLQVDAYAGFEPLFLPTKPGVAARVEEISCMAHARRFFMRCTSRRTRRSPKRRSSALAVCIRSKIISVVVRLSAWRTSTIRSAAA